MKSINKLESNVRSYCRAFPTVFTKGRGHRLWDEDGKEYIDFFAGAGALNYGHNPPEFKKELLDYLAEDNVIHGLDMATAAKVRFLERFHEIILEPRGMPHKVMFPGPTGTNAVESALKLARKVTGREGIVSFTNAFHGMTLGALAVTGNAFKRGGAGVPLNHGIAMPFDRYYDYEDDDAEFDSLDFMDRMLVDGGSGVDMPAAVIAETVQGEGGLRAARFKWLRRLQDICRQHDILLIVDDIQAGCGRTGPFFSFEPAGIEPDIICLSKSISGYGLPMALVLIKPEYDQFGPGEHNGTFRGNNAAFVTAAAALENWRTDDLTRGIEAKSQRIRKVLGDIVERHPEIKGEVRGRGLMQGLVCGVEGLARNICSAGFERGLIMETSGPDSEVVKLMPPLNIDDDALDQGLDILAEAVEAALKARKTLRLEVA